MKVAVCDDNKLVLQQLKEMIHDIEFVKHLDLFSDLGRFKQSLENGDTYDVVIMDINWDSDKRGIETASHLYAQHPDIQIIYLTGYVTEYVQEVFLAPANMSGFIMKPIKAEILRENLYKIVKQKQESINTRLIIKQKSGWLSIMTDSIIYIESEAHTVIVHTAAKSYSTYSKIEVIKSRLNNNFLHCHKSYLVNMDYVSSIGKRKIILDTGIEIPISKMRYNDTKERYFTYIQTKIFS